MTKILTAVLNSLCGKSDLGLLVSADGVAAANTPEPQATKTGELAVTVDPRHITVISEPSQTNDSIKDAVSVPGGGIFAVGNHDGEHWWALKLGG